MVVEDQRPRRNEDAARSCGRQSWLQPPGSQDGCDSQPANRVTAGGAERAPAEQARCPRNAAFHSGDHVRRDSSSTGRSATGWPGLAHGTQTHPSQTRPRSRQATHTGTGEPTPDAEWDYLQEDRAGHQSRGCHWKPSATLEHKASAGPAATHRKCTQLQTACLSPPARGLGSGVPFNLPTWLFTPRGDCVPQQNRKCQ